MQIIVGMLVVLIILTILGTAVVAGGLTEATAALAALRAPRAKDTFGDPSPWNATVCRAGAPGCEPAPPGHITAADRLIQGGVPPGMAPDLEQQQRLGQFLAPIDEGGRLPPVLGHGYHCSGPWCIYTQ